MSNEEITYEQVLEYCQKRNLDLVDHAFLVRLYNNGKAIPVEWLKERYLDFKHPKWSFMLAEAITIILKDWEEENETS